MEKLSPVQQLIAWRHHIEEAIARVPSVDILAPPTRLTQEPPDEWLKRHESYYHDEVEVALIDWIDGKPIKVEHRSAFFWIRARLEFAIMLASVVTAPLGGDGCPYFPLDDEDNLDDDWKSWSLLEAWDHIGCIYTIGNLACRFSADFGAN